MGDGVWLLPMKKRLCHTCKKELPENGFHASELRKDYPRCKGCRSAHGARAYRVKLAQDPAPGPRFCWKCNRTLPESEFYAEQLHRNRPQCKSCKRAYAASHYNALHRDRKCFHCREPLEDDDERLCKGCKAKRRAEYHAKGDTRRAANRERKRRLKKQVMDAYGGPRCACCGETAIEFLTIDHINGDGGEHRRKLKAKHGYVVEIYRWLKNNRYPKGFQVLCWNCNCAKAHFGACPHEAERRRRDMRSGL